MEAESIKLEVVTPEKAVLTEEVDAVELPGTEGQIGVLPGHMPLLTLLEIGEMVLYREGDERRFFVMRGFAEILSDRVRVLAEECQGVENIDIEKAREELAEAEEEVRRLRERPGATEEELVEKWREAQKKARTQLMLSGEDVDDEG